MMRLLETRNTALVIRVEPQGEQVALNCNSLYYHGGLKAKGDLAAAEFTACIAYTKNEVVEPNQTR